MPYNGMWRHEGLLPRRAMMEPATGEVSSLMQFVASCGIIGVRSGVRSDGATDRLRTRACREAERGS